MNLKGWVKSEVYLKERNNKKALLISNAFLVYIFYLNKAF